jgi:hypothetical protein
VSEHRKASMLAAAGIQDIISQGAAIQACALRGDGQEPREAIRSKAHALLDAYLDNMADAGTHARALHGE